MEDLGVVDGLENRLLKNFWEEGVLVGRLVAADQRLETFLLAEDPVKQAGIGLANVDTTRAVDGLVEGELDALDQVEGDCVFQTAGPQSVGDSDAREAGVHELEADVGKVERLGDVGEVDGSVHGGSAAGELGDVAMAASSVVAMRALVESDHRRRALRRADDAAQRLAALPTDVAPTC